MKKLSLLVLVVLAASSVFAGKYERQDVVYTGKNVFEKEVDLQGTTKINSVALTSTAAELNILDGVTADAAELNTAADPSTRSVSTSVTNGQAITLSAATPIIALTGIGSPNDNTNTVTIATPYPVGTEFTLHVAVGSTNLITIADSTTVLAIGSAWLADETDVLKFLTTGTNTAVKTSSEDN